MKPFPLVVLVPPSPGALLLPVALPSQGPLLPAPTLLHFRLSSGPTGRVATPALRGGIFVSRGLKSGCAEQVGV